MLKYILKRILIFIPTLFVVSLLTFIIISMAPGDPAETMLNRNSGGEGQASDKLATDEAYQIIRHRLGLDLPVFYFSFTSKADCDTINRIAKKVHRETLQRLTYDYGNWPLVSNYYNAISNLENTVLNVPRDSANAEAVIALRSDCSRLYENHADNVLKDLFADIRQNLTFGSLAPVKPYLAAAEEAYLNMKENPTRWKNYIPVIQWNGLNNQYHHWLFGEAKWFGMEQDKYKSRGFLRGDFGISFFSKRPVSDMIWEAVQITMLISFISIFLEFLISIPTGVYSAVNKNTPAEQVVTTGLFMLYSLPSFWIGTMLIFFLGGGDYLDIFPPAGLGDTTIAADGFFTRMGDLGYHLVLPLFCWTYGAFAFLSRQMRGGMLSVLGQDYIRTARSKGLPNNKVVWRHAFRNSLLPVITIFASVFPAIISGAVVLEFIFTIPGMGKQGLDAVLRKDYPIVLTTTMMAAILTLIGYLISDILYAIVDPRISYSKK